MAFHFESTTLYLGISIGNDNVPGPPRELRLSTKRTSKMIKIRWFPPEDHADKVERYELQMKRKMKHDWEFVCYSYKLSAKATDLKSNTEYLFRVYSRDKNGDGNFSDTIEGKTRLGKAAVAALTPLVFVGGTLASPFIGTAVGGVGGGLLAGKATVDSIDNTAGAVAAGVPAGVAGGVAGAVGGGVVGTVGAPVVGGVLARQFVKHGDSYSDQSSDEDDD
jgi:hypothetical protein